MRSPSRLVFLLIFALFGCAFTDPEMTVITNETSEDVKQSEGNKLLGVVTNGEGKVEGPSFGISGSATVGIEGEATGMEGSIEDKKPHGEEDADEAKRKLAMSDVGEGHVQVNGTTNADLEENESSMVYQEPTEEEKMPGKEVSAAEVIEGNTTDGGVVMEADKTEAHAQPNDEENVTKSQEETSDGPLGPKDDQKSHADEGSDVEGVERDAAVLEANSEGGEGSVHIDALAVEAISVKFDDEEDVMEADIGQAHAQVDGPIEEKKLRDDEGSDEKEIERKAAEEKAVIEEGEATIIVDVSPIPTIEDQKAFEAASESVGSLTLTSAVLWATVSLLPIIH
ncbi:Prokaryotic membrane lipoprotein lipid [Echinococcus multilocularis]|uniref:Prokaryotic membrane lipoprotein lipid n=1 Tax=Echinococcus multilocularis TaxID=6211 RepID=A0A068XV88_ECHMU|nr:Prokaryotic membrane lipoprotein lipid [Echinococcus multilocularis]